MVRCTMCVDPGLLPLETDMAKHRREVHRNKLFYCDMCDQGERGARGFAGFADAAKHVAEENGINPTDKMNIHDMMRIPKTETHLKVFRCLFCGAEGKLFVGMSEESFLEHVSKQHGAKSAMKRPHKLQRECRICNERFEADLPLTRHIKKTHIERGPQNPYPFAGFGPKEDAEEDDEVLVEVVPVEAVSSKRRTRRRSTSASDSESEDEVLEESIRRGIAKTKKKRQRLESELDRRQAAPQARQDPELIGPDTFFFVCSLCGKKDIDQFNIFEHLDEEHCLGENEAVLKQKTFRPRAVLACRFCPKIWHGEPLGYRLEMRAHREDKHREENISVKDCFKLQCRGCPSGSFTLEQEPQLKKHIKICPGWQSKEVSRTAVSRTIDNINKHLVAGASERELTRRKEEVRGPSSRGDSRREERSRSRESSLTGRSRDERSEYPPKREERSSFRDQDEGRSYDRSRKEDRRREERCRYEDGRNDERSRHSGREERSGQRDLRDQRDERKPWGVERDNRQGDFRSFGRDRGGRGGGFDRGGGRGGRGGFD